MSIPSNAKGYGNNSTARNVFRLTFSTALSAAPVYEAYDGATFFPDVGSALTVTSTVLAGTSGNGNKSMVCLVDTSSGAPSSNWKPSTATNGSLNPNRLKGQTSYVTATATPGAGGTITWNEVLEVPSDAATNSTFKWDLLVRYKYTGTAPTLTWSFNDDTSGGGTEGTPVWTNIEPGIHGVRHTRAGVTTGGPYLANIPATGTADTGMGWVTDEFPLVEG